MEKDQFNAKIQLLFFALPCSEEKLAEAKLKIVAEIPLFVLELL